MSGHGDALHVLASPSGLSARIRWSRSPGYWLAQHLVQARRTTRRSDGAKRVDAEMCGGWWPLVLVYRRSRVQHEA